MGFAGRMHAVNKVVLRHRKYLEHLITVMVDYLNGYFAGAWLVKRPASGGIQGGPCTLVNFGPQGPLKFVVWFSGTGKISVPHEKALAVVIGVDKPACDVVGGAGPYFAGGGVIHVQTL